MRIDEIYESNQIDLLTCTDLSAVCVFGYDIQFYYSFVLGTVYTYVQYFYFLHIHVHSHMHTNIYVNIYIYIYIYMQSRISSLVS